VLESYSSRTASRRPGLAARVGVAFLILCAEKSFLNIFVDFERAQSATGFGAALRVSQHIVFRMLVTLALALVILAPLRGREHLVRCDRAMREAPVSLAWLAVHATLLAPLAVLSSAMFKPGHEALLPALAAGWLACALLSTLALFGAFAPRSLWWNTARGLGATWVYSLLIAVAAVSLISYSKALWPAAVALCFRLVRAVLTPLNPGLHADTTSQTLDTGHFAVHISDECSGLEGIGLMLAFGIGWLAYLRRSYRFPHALVLLPLGATLVFLLNVLRIVALVEIGDAGYSDIAVYGFHSQGGWITFNIAAAVVALASLKIDWLRVAPSSSSLGSSGIRIVRAGDEERMRPDPTVVYLLPFLTVLGAAIVSRSLSTADLEPFYGLRLLAGISTLLFVRRGLGQIDWRFSWRGVAAGAALFVFWIGVAPMLEPARGEPSTLRSLTPAIRDSWVSVRACTSILLIPLVEELAYRGFLMRRLVSARFESVDYGRVGFVPLLASSIVFGAIHGALWPAGIVAGLVMGTLLIRTCRLGEAVAAHATCNALIAIAVIGWNRWELW